MFFAAIFLSRLSFLYLLQGQLLKYVHVGTYDILLGTSVFGVDQLQSIKKYILSYTYDLLLCYLWLQSIVKRIILNTKFKCTFEILLRTFVAELLSI